jgi:ABC-type antimicrobial peptide transport system permease subunit
VVIALEAIRSNKVRAFLTIFGVAIGVFVVVAMAAAVHGMTASFKQDVEAFGAYLVPGAGARSTSASAPTRTIRAAAIRR